MPLRVLVTLCCHVYLSLDQMKSLLVASTTLYDTHFRGDKRNHVFSSFGMAGTGAPSSSRNSASFLAWSKCRPTLCRSPGP